MSHLSKDINQLQYLNASECSIPNPVLYSSKLNSCYNTVSLAYMLKLILTMTRYHQGVITLNDIFR